MNEIPLCPECPPPSKYCAGHLNEGGKQKINLCHLNDLPCMAEAREGTWATVGVQQSLVELTKQITKINPPSFGGGQL